MVAKTDYGRREVEASHSVLLELIHVLGEFRDYMVVVGGSVPPLLYPHVADKYENITVAEERDRLVRYAFERVDYLLISLGS
jgi:hypothetical protein